MPINEEQIDEMIKAVKSGDLSIWKKNPRNVGMVHLLSKLSNLPKNQIPRFDMARVRNQILDRISIPQIQDEKSGWYTKVSAYMPYFRITAGVMASLLIVISLTLGTAVTALNSTPGSGIYPLKKIVENIQLKLTPNDQKANLQLKFADNRADELQQVLDNQQDGKISDQEAQTIVASTVQDLQKTAAAAVTATKAQPKTKSTAIVTKLTDISNKLRAASVQSEGLVKIELEKAIVSTQVSTDEAIKNLASSDDQTTETPAPTDDSVKAAGKLTAVSETSISIGTAKFLLNADTKFTDMEAKDLKMGVSVDIVGKIKDNKSYAVSISITKTTDTTTDTTAPATTPDPAPVK